MNIIAHRGYWRYKYEKNTMVAFQRAIRFGFGIETDFRDFNNALYIAHDPIEDSRIPANDFFELITEFNGTLAINVKSTGLQTLLKPFTMQLKNYFIFDSTLPDYLTYLSQGFLCYLRISEYEKPTIFSDHPCVIGFWLDQLESSWYTDEYIIELVQLNKKICIVSPELHGNDPLSFWQRLSRLVKKDLIQFKENISICTDFPLECRRLMNETDSY